MPEEDKLLTLHLQGKKRVRNLKYRCNLVKNLIINTGTSYLAALLLIERTLKTSLQKIQLKT
ncbi:hypothetical protein [Chondrinema litorale]|uniref:hypothetical protein n=1 Tax=Chondrinema litorale TaxID=2994555 RepID=UPI0025433378|nr:hypothetical protein [Chondrinema litorale]UZR95269.1 hypothetical protein OQ292_05480 [Chondrinema litorale]